MSAGRDQLGNSRGLTSRWEGAVPPVARFPPGSPGLREKLPKAAAGSQLLPTVSARRLVRFDVTDRQTM